jgi:putative flippase GtrA
MTLSRQLPRFIAVGTAAAATHLGVVVALVETVGIAPLVANLGGWCAAFGVSFAGHWHLTFAGSGADARMALRRFVLISMGGFLINEAAYAWLLHRSGAGYALLLAGVLLGVAALTFLLSRGWAFAGRPPGGAPDR